MTELDDLKRKLAAREKMGGFAANAEELKARIDFIENGQPKYKSARTGKWVTDEFAAANPDTTYRSNRA